MTSSRAWQFAAFAFKIAISIGFLALLLVETNKVKFSKIASAVSPTTIGFVIGIVIFQMAAISACRLKLVIRLFGCNLTIANAARITWTGFFIEQVGAFFVAGDIARIWLMRQLAVPTSAAIEGAFVDRIIGLATISAMAALGMPHLWWGLSADWQNAFLIATEAVGVALLLFLVLIASFAGLRGRIATAAAEIRSQGKSTMRILTGSSRGPLATVSLLAFATHSLNVVAIYLLLTAVGVEIGLATCFVFTPTVLLASMLPVSLSGWGVREGALVLALRSFGVPAEEVLTASLLFGICILIGSLPGAITWLFIPERRKSASSR